MTAKSSRSESSSSDAGAAVLAPLNFLADLPRRQLALLTQQAAAMFRGSEALRKAQLEAAHRAFTEHSEASKKLRGPCDFNDLIAIQTELIRFNIQEAAQYWQQLATAALKVQAEVVSSAGEVPEIDEPSLDSLQRAFAASLNGGAASRAPH